jgi:beta-glucosidase-like glycosyl hydrolase
MKALDPYGDVPARAAASLAAGCDLALDCFGAVHDLEKVAQAVSKMVKTLA